MLLEPLHVASVASRDSVLVFSKQLKNPYVHGLESRTEMHVGSCQNYGPFLGTLNNRCRTIIGTQKGTIILTTTHVDAG